MLNLTKSKIPLKPITTQLTRQYSTIKNIYAREVLTSNGIPTIEAIVETEKGFFRGISTSSLSTGKHNSKDLRDNDSARYNGMGVLKAIEKVESVIKPALVGKDPTCQFDLDRLLVEELDGTKDDYGWSKANLGTNTINAVSLAIARAGAKEKRMKLYEYVSFMTGEDHKKHIMPVPLITVVNGGVYSSGSLWLEDIFLMPQGAESYSEALRMGSECYFALQQIMEEADPNSLNTGFSGGLTPNIIDAEEILQLIQRAIKAAGHEGLVTIGVDAGAQNFYDEVEDAYNLNFKVNKTQGPNYMNSDEMIDFYVKIAEEYGVQLIEDPFHEDAWESYRVLNTKLNNNVRSISNQVQLVGDNLLASNIQRIKIGARKKSCNTLMLKPNQIGSVSEAIKAASEADNQDFSLIVSQRGGETEDNFICDLAIGLNTGQVKLGAPMRGERTAKHNRMMRIEQRLDNRAVFAGESMRNPYWLLQ